MDSGLFISDEKHEKVFDLALVSETSRSLASLYLFPAMAHQQPIKVTEHKIVPFMIFSRF